MTDAAAGPSALTLALLANYLQIKHAHMGLALASVAWFAARGVGVFAGARWPMAAGARWASMAIDTLLLVAGVTLWTLLHLNPVRDAWLGVKLLLLVAYVVAGSLALKRAATRGGRTVAFAVALALFAAMFGVARAHHPLGWFAPTLAG